MCAPQAPISWRATTLSLDWAMPACAQTCVTRPRSGPCSGPTCANGTELVDRTPRTRSARRAAFLRTVAFLRRRAQRRDERDEAETQRKKKRKAQNFKSRTAHTRARSRRAFLHYSFGAIRCIRHVGRRVIDIRSSTDNTHDARSIDRTNPIAQSPIVDIRCVHTALVPPPRQGETGRNSKH